MHREILNCNQTDLLPLVNQFKREFYLVGGTAIALHLGHRRSIVFDLFKPGKLFRAQLSYFDDIDYSEQIEFLHRQPSDRDIKKYLIEQSIDISQ